MLFCVLFNHQSREPLAGAGIAEALCCSLFWQRDQGRAKEGLFHALKGAAFPDRHGNAEMSQFAGADAALVSP